MSRILCTRQLQTSIANSVHKLLSDSIQELGLSEYFDITRQDIIGKKKSKEVVEPRMIAIYLISEILEIPLVSIGKLFGGRDHTTILHARNKIEEQCKTDGRMAVYVKDLKDMILKR